MKSMLAVFICLLSSALMAETINLECDVTARMKTSAEKGSSEKGQAFVEISEVGEEVFVEISSEVSGVHDFSINTLVSDNSQRISAGKNLSTESKWEITQSSGKKKDGSIENVTEKRFFVDRTTGLMVLSVEFTVSGAQLFINASGNCKKASRERLF